MEKCTHVANFGGGTLDFFFITEDEYCYPQVNLEGEEGSSATLHGQHMSPEDIKELGMALIDFAAKLEIKNAD